MVRWQAFTGLGKWTYRLVETCSRHLQMASFSFDVFAGDFARALGSGGAMVICPSAFKLDPPLLYGLMRRPRLILRSLCLRLPSCSSPFWTRTALICRF